MVVSNVHDTMTLWRIWYALYNTVIAQSDGISNEDRNAYIWCPQSVTRKNSRGTEQLEEITHELPEIDPFDLPQE
jgi:hypothetical protein